MILQRVTSNEGISTSNEQRVKSYASINSLKVNRKNEFHQLLNLLSKNMNFKSFSSDVYEFHSCFRESIFLEINFTDVLKQQGKPLEVFCKKRRS